MSVLPRANAASGSKGNTTDKLTWFLLVLLFLGDVASVVGYVGCFSVVQSARLSSAPVIWLSSEIVLSLVRFFLWGYNPKQDDAPPLEFILNLNDHPPLPTCNRFNDQILKNQVLPLTRASQFLESIASFAGHVKHFSRPGLTLYYTLTRAGPKLESDENQWPRSAHERVLYITVFDHEERTTRVFTQHSRKNLFYSADLPNVDIEHDQLEAKLGKVLDSKIDPIVGDGDIQLLVKHYQSLIRYTIGRARRNKEYRVGTPWTMRAKDVKFESDNGDDSGDDEDAYLDRDRLYLEQGRFEAMQRSLGVARGEWIQTYMCQVIAETRERLQAEEASIRKVDEILADEANTKGRRKEPDSEQAVEGESNGTTVDIDDESEVVEGLLIEERRLMEKLFVYEVETWEDKLWKKAEEFIRSDEVQEKERVKKEWETNCWKRFRAHIQAMDKRMEDAKADIKETNDDRFKAVHGEIQETWKSAQERFVRGARPSSTKSCRNRLEEDLRNVKTRMVRKQQQVEMKSRLGKELDDVEFRFEQGLDKCDQFWGGDRLVRARHSRAKWLDMPISSDKAKLEAFSRALETRNDVIYIDFWGSDIGWVIESIQMLPSLTSVIINKRDKTKFLHRIPDIQRDSPLSVNTEIDWSDTNEDAHSDGTNDALTILPNNKKPVNKTQRTFIFITNPGRSPAFSSTEIGLNHPSLVISFFGPPSGTLTLRLRHRSSRPEATLIVTGSPKRFKFEYPIPSSHSTQTVPNSFLLRRVPETT